MQLYSIMRHTDPPLRGASEASAPHPLGGLGSRMPMRRETLKAIETARDNLMQVAIFVMHCCQKSKETVFMDFSTKCSILIVAQERKQSKMRTLGASNPHNNNKDKHRENTR